MPGEALQGAGDELVVGVRDEEEIAARELPRLEKFLSRPNFHLGIDPEFSMKNGGIPGKKIGTYDAADVNYASRFLQDIVTRYQLPPKVLVVHRFTRNGVTNTHAIKLDPRMAQSGIIN